MKALSIIKTVFTLAGIAMLVGAYFLFQNTQYFLKDALTAEGTVIELVRVRSSDSTTYKPVVTFKTQSGSMIEFASSTSSNPPAYSQGEIVEVLYQESSPEKARINGFFSLWGAPVILGGLGFVFFLVGFGIIFFGILKNRKTQYLKRHGIPITTKFQSVEINGSLEVNGRNPYQICSQWKNPATSELHIFLSENIWFDPTDHISGDKITVLIEQDNPSKYYVDISFLPNIAD